MALVYDKTLYDRQYSVRAWEHGFRNTPRCPRHHYSHFVQRERIRKTVQMILDLDGFDLATNILLIGGGFGWTGERLQDNHAKIVVNVDPSPYIQANKNVSEEVEIRQWLIDDGFDPDNIDYLMHEDQTRTLTNAEVWARWLRADNIRTNVETLDEDLDNGPSRNRTRLALPNMDFIVTEWVLDSWQTSQEANAFCNNVNRTRPDVSVPIVHITDYAQNPPDGMISRTVNHWRTWLDSNGWTDHVVVNSRGLVGV